MAEWQAGLGQWDIDLTNRFVSDAFIQYDNRLRFRDEDILRIRATRPLASTLDARVTGGMDWFGTSRAFTQALYLGTRYGPSRVVYVEPFVGVASDRRPGVRQPDGAVPQRTDTGPTLGITGAYRPESSAGYRLRLSAEGAWQRIAPRRAAYLQAEGGAERAFGPAQLSTALSFHSRRRDTYQAASYLNRDQIGNPEAIEATVSDTLNAQMLLQTPLIAGMSMIAQADVQVNSRRIRSPNLAPGTLYFETDFRRRAIDGAIGLYLDREHVNAYLSAELGATTEQRSLRNRDALPASEATQKTVLLRQADYDEGALALTGSVQAHVLPRLSLAFSGSSRIVRHDTPTVNLDDRDEIYQFATVGFSYRASQYLTAETRLYGSYYHVVFLNAERSAENSVQRALRLRPSVDWRPGEGTRMRLASEVRATYTTDDFVLAGRRPTDQSAREWRMNLEFQQHVALDTEVHVDATIAELHLGRLQWDQFAEIPIDTLRTLSGWARIRTGRRLVGEFGWRTFIRSDYDRSVTVRYALVNAQGQPLLDPAGQPRMGSITRPGQRWIIQGGPAGALIWTRGQALAATGCMGQLAARALPHLRHASGNEPESD